MRPWTCALALVACGGGKDPAPKPFEARNLLMISIDTLRRDHVSRYDPEGRDLTPFLADRMAQGWVADDHRSCSNWTYHATTCALSGRTEVELGQFVKLEGFVAERWDDSVVFLPDALEAAGFDTTFATANGFLQRELGVTDAYEGYTFIDYAAARDLYDASVGGVAAAMEAHPDARWAYHLHFMDPHAPYRAPESYNVGEDALEPLPYEMDTHDAHYGVTDDLWPTMTPEEQALLEAHLRIRYAGGVRWLDDQIRDIWADLDARGWLDDTLVVVWSDHGEQFWEHDHQTHAYQLFPEENDAIFFVWAKEGLPAEAVSRPTSHVDVLPTTLALLGLDVPEEVSGLPLDRVPQGRPMFAASRGRLGTLQSVELARKRLIYHWSGNARYHDLAVDPLALDDQFDASNPDVQELWGLLAPVVREADALVPADTALPVPGLPL